jgi:hypothetical protein
VLLTLIGIALILLQAAYGDRALQQAFQLWTRSTSMCYKSLPLSCEDGEAAAEQVRGDTFVPTVGVIMAVMVIMISLNTMTSRDNHFLRALYGCSVR